MTWARILRRRFVIQLLAASTVGRMPGAMTVLAIALTLRSQHVPFGWVGLVGGAYGVGVGVGGPVLGRLVDLRGQTPVLIGSASSAACGYVLLAAASRHPAVCLPGAVVAGLSTPPIEACLRGLWPLVVAPGELDSAYALDAACQELIFILGPAMEVAIVSRTSPVVGLWAAPILLGLGVAGLASAAPSRRWAPAARRVDWLGPLRSRRLTLVLLAMCGSGWAVGAYDVYVVAYAERHRVLGGGGTLMALAAAGALTGALGSGALSWRGSRTWRIRVLASGLGLAYWPLVAIPGRLLIYPAAFATGLFLAPLLAVVFSVIQQTAPRGTTTEAFSWLVTLFALGMAVGAAAGGWTLGRGHLAGEAALGASGATIGMAVLVRACRGVFAADHDEAAQPAERNRS